MWICQENTDSALDQGWIRKAQTNAWAGQSSLQQSLSQNICLYFKEEWAQPIKKEGNRSRNQRTRVLSPHRLATKTTEDQTQYIQGYRTQESIKMIFLVFNVQSIIFKEKISYSLWGFKDLQGASERLADLQPVNAYTPRSIKELMAIRNLSALSFLDEVSQPSVDISEIVHQGPDYAF